MIYRKGMQSIYRMSDAQPDWAETDPSQPDYIKNKELAEKLRPIFINGEPMLGETYSSGGVNIEAGKNITLTVDGNTIIVSARGSNGEGGGGCDCPEYLEGDAIDIREAPNGNKVVSIEPNSISDKHIESISLDKITQSEFMTLILDGGNIDNGIN